MMIYHYQVRFIPEMHGWFNIAKAKGFSYPTKPRK